MKRLMYFGVFMIAVVAALPAEASGPTERRGACDSINLGQARVFYKSHIRCGKAKRFARRLYRTDGNHWPRHFTCQSQDDFNAGGGCQHEVKTGKYFGWHSIDKQKRSAERPRA